MVRTALTYLSSLSGEAAGDPALQHELAKAYLKVGDVLGNPQTSNLGDMRAALQNYRRALTLTDGRHPGGV